MFACPLKTSDDWRNLVSVHGEDGAYKEFVKNSFEIPSVTPAQAELTNKMLSFVKALNVDVKQFDELLEVTGYDAVSATDLLNKTILLSDKANIKNLSKETAYIAYSLMGKKNKIMTELRRSIDQLDNYQSIYNQYKERSPKLGDFKVRELIVIDYLADAIHNNFEHPKDSYANKKAEFWSIKGNYALERRVKYLLSVVKRYILNLLNMSKMSKDEVQNHLDDIANDILNQNLQKFNAQLKPEQQLTNYNDTIKSDPKAEEIVKNFQKLGIVLTGSLALRRQGTVYRDKAENLHDLDFSVQNHLIDSELRADIKKLHDNLEGQTNAARGFIIEKFTKDLMKTYQNYQWFKQVKELYPDFKITNVISDKGSADLTITGKVNDYIIDFFVKGSDKTVVENQDDMGFQHWKHIFAAKVRLGRAKDMLDFINWKPFNMENDKFADMSGFRHFSFTSERSKFDNIINKLIEAGELEMSCSA